MLGSIADTRPHTSRPTYDTVVAELWREVLSPQIWTRVHWHEIQQKGIAHSVALKSGPCQTRLPNFLWASFQLKRRHNTDGLYALVPFLVFLVTKLGKAVASTWEVVSPTRIWTGLLSWDNGRRDSTFGHTSFFCFFQLQHVYATDGTSAIFPHLARYFYGTSWNRTLKPDLKLGLLG